MVCSEGSKVPDPEQAYIAQVAAMIAEAELATIRSYWSAAIGSALLLTYFLIVMPLRPQVQLGDLIIIILVSGTALIGYYYQHRLAGELREHIKTKEVKKNLALLSSPPR